MIRAEVVRRGITYRQLAVLLGRVGVSETERSIASKLSRGSFSFVFALQCFKALGVEELDVRVQDVVSATTPLGSSKVPEKAS